MDDQLDKLCKSNVFMAQNAFEERHKGDHPTVRPSTLFKDSFFRSIWVWLEGLRRFWSMFPLTRVPVLVPVF